MSGMAKKDPFLKAICIICDEPCRRILLFSICAGFCQHWKHSFPNRMRTKKPKRFSSSSIQISSNKFKAPTFKSPPTISKLQHSNLLRQIQSSNFQISSNKLKAPTFKFLPTNSKLQLSNLRPTNSNLYPTN